MNTLGGMEPERQPPTRITISSGGRWEPIMGYSRAVRVGPWIAVSGTTAAGPEGTADTDDAAEQTREILRRIEVALREAGATLSDVIRTRILVTDISLTDDVGAVHGEIFGDIRPACTMAAVGALVDPSLLVEIEADAIVAP